MRELYPAIEGLAGLEGEDIAKLIGFYTPPIPFYMAI
jgi:hypothetical protein